MPNFQDTIQNQSSNISNARKHSIAKDLTVLVVEDNVENFVFITRMLSYLGIHCEWKPSGYEVVDYAHKLPRLDIILLDIQLPFEDGFGVLKKLRSSDHLMKIPIIAISSTSDDKQINKARREGFDGFIGTPVDPDRFLDIIRRILAGDKVWEVY